MRWKTARLSSPARGLLLAIIQARLDGIDRMTAGEWKEEAGVGNHRDWGVAIEQLRDMGLATLTKQGHSYVITDLSFNGFGRDETDRQKEINSEIDSLSIYRTTDAKAAEHDAGDQLLADLGLDFSSNGLKSENSSNGLKLLPSDDKYRPNELNPEKYSPNGLKQNIGQMNYISEYRPNDLKLECIQVDTLDDSGDLARSSSPAQVRRRSQLAVVQKTWDKFFGTELLAQNAKFFLAHLDNSAEAVYDYFEWLESMHKDNPLAYGKKVLVNREREQAPVSPAVPVLAPEPEPVSQAEMDRVDRAAHRARVANWKRWHPDEPVPEDL